MALRASSSFHVREDVAPLKHISPKDFEQSATGFHVREDVAPLKHPRPSHRGMSADRFHVREDVAPLKHPVLASFLYPVGQFPRSRGRGSIEAIFGVQAALPSGAFPRS